MSCTRHAKSFEVENITCDVLTKEKIEEVEHCITNVLVEKFKKINTVKLRSAQAYYYNGVIAINEVSNSIKSVAEAFGMTVKEVNGYTLLIDPIFEAVKKFGLNISEQDIMAAIGAMPATAEVKALIEKNIRKVSYNSSYSGIVNNVKANGVYKTVNNVEIDKEYYDGQFVRETRKSSVDAGAVTAEVQNVLDQVQNVVNHLYDDMANGVSETVKVRAEELGYQVEQVFNEEEQQVQLILTRLD